MTDKLVLNSVVTYAAVDRDEVLTLAGVFKLLQDAAIAHANQFDTGTRAMLTRGESWVLNRIAVEIARYPRFEESVRVETWSSGIRGFKGYRDFRAYDASGAPWLRGSSLWLYVNARTKTIVRVPADVAAGFPAHGGEVFCPELEKMEFAAPAAEAVQTEVTLRYADFDANAHVNNTAYLDFLQTALARAGRGSASRATGRFARWARRSSSAALQPALFGHPPPEIRCQQLPREIQSNLWLLTSGFRSARAEAPRY